MNKANYPSVLQPIKINQIILPNRIIFHAVNANYGEAPFIDIAETIKQFTTVPVCTVGSISSLETAEKIIAENKADLVAIGRAQIADPYLIKKSFAGDEKNIRRCLRCNKCLYWATGDAKMHCVMNPWLSHEAD